MAAVDAAAAFVSKMQNATHLYAVCGVLRRRSQLNSALSLFWIMWHVVRHLMHVFCIRARSLTHSRALD